MLPHTLVGIDDDENGGFDALVFDVLTGVTGERFDSAIARQLSENGIVFPTFQVGGH